MVAATVNVWVVSGVQQRAARVRRAVGHPGSADAAGMNTAEYTI
jgi:hypothetical protein